MPGYQPYPNKKNTPNRKTRKGARNVAFMKNKLAARKQREARVALRKPQDVEEQSEN